MTRKAAIRKWFTGLLSIMAGFTSAAFSAPGQPPEALLTMANPRVLEVAAIQERLTPELMATEGVLGTAVGQDEAGALSVVVFVNVESKNAGQVVAALAKGLHGVRPTVHLTDPFRAMGKPSGGGARASHTARQTPPIQLGTSGGWRFDSANGYCCGGTLGSLIQVNGIQYIMSNYHVFESDIEPGGNGLTASTGNPVIQPGLIDVQCNAGGAQNVGTLVKLSSLPTSNVDVGIAQASSAMVSSEGSILEIGTISSQTVSPFQGQLVKKSGRTTGLTRSKVSGLNATISVQYDNECAGGWAFTKTFTGQIVIANRGSKFLAGGDSGSLMVEDVASNPKAVGLLYAGSSTSAIANPIGHVLAFVGSKLNGAATMVGQ